MKHIHDSFIDNDEECIYTTLPPQAGYEKRPIFEKSTAGLNSEFSSSYIGCLTKAKELSLPCNLPISGWERRDGFMSFTKASV